MCTIVGDYIIDFYCIAINIGFEQERYTVFKDNGQLSRIPIIKENGQKSELTFGVIVTLTLGSDPTTATADVDFFASPPIQRQDLGDLEQFITYVFEIYDDSPPVPEPTETFQIQLSLEDEGLTNVNLAASSGSLFATATIVIIDDDGKRLCLRYIILMCHIAFMVPTNCLTALKKRHNCPATLMYPGLKRHCLGTWDLYTVWGAGAFQTPTHYGTSVIVRLQFREELYFANPTSIHLEIATVVIESKLSLLSFPITLFSLLHKFGIACCPVRLH